MTLGRKPVRYPTTGGATVEVYPDGGGLWRWRRKDPDGLVLHGREGYTRRDAALRAARRHHPPQGAQR